MFHEEVCLKKYVAAEGNSKSDDCNEKEHRVLLIAPDKQCGRDHTMSFMHERIP